LIRELHGKFGIPASVLIQPARKPKKTARRAAQRLRSARLKKSA